MIADVHRLFDLFGGTYRELVEHSRLLRRSRQALHKAEVRASSEGGRESARSSPRAENTQRASEGKLDFALQTRLASFGGMTSRVAGSRQRSAY